MKKEVIAEPPDDIPAWFMTYSDVITLLMTFFILLLTFSTTEPERYSKETVNYFGESGSSGVAGYKYKRMETNSWVQRVRPRAARVAMRGSEIPPTEQAQGKEVGPGLKSADAKAKERDVMRTFAFSVLANELVTSDLEVTPRGAVLAQKLGPQLQNLPVHCVIEFSDAELLDRCSSFADHLIHVEKARPGQVACGKADSVDTTMIRIVIERYEL